MQIFLCISGFLYGQKEIGNVVSFYHNRIKKILVPYYIVFIPYGILQFLFARNVFSLRLFLRGLIAGNAVLKGGGHLWFVPLILLCYVGTPLLEAYRNKYVNCRISYLKFVFSAIFIASLFFYFFCSFFNPAWVSCYIMGYALGINEKRNFVNKKHVLALTGCLAVICNSIQIYCSYIAQIRFPLYSTFCDYSHALLGAFLFLLMKILFDKVSLGKIKIILDTTDKYSYESYLVHQFVILGPFSLLAIIHPVTLSIVIILVVIYILAVGLKKVECAIFHWL